MSNTAPETNATPSPARRPVHTFVRIGLSCIGLLLLSAAIVPKVRLALVWAAGRCGSCSLRSSLDSHNLLVNMTEAGNRIGGSSRIVRTDGSFELVSTPMGEYWTVKNDRFLRFTLAEEQLSIYGAEEEGVKPGDVVFDCGANVGVFTRTALNLGAKQVIAVEPAPATVACLRRNFETEISQGRVIVVPKGVWDRTDVLELAQGDEGNTTGDSFVLGRDQKNKVKVPLTTIDILVDELKLERVDFIKMDIEGAEKQALRGATHTIGKFRPRMAIAAEHLPDDEQAIPQVVASILPEYKVQSASCKDAFLSVKPEVLLFRTK